MNINWKEGEPLPNAEKAKIDQSKFTQYSIKGFNDKSGNLITIWQIDRDKTIPRLITNWVEVYN